MRFRILEVSPNTPADIRDDLIQNRHAFQGAKLDIEAFARDSNIVMDPPFHYTGTAFWRFLERLGEGHCRQSQQNCSSLSSALSSPSLVWFRQIWLRCFELSREFGDNLLRLPIVRRHSIVHISTIDTIERVTCTSGIVDWLFDDTDYSGGG